MSLHAPEISDFDRHLHQRHMEYTVWQEKMSLFCISEAMPDIDTNLTMRDTMRTNLQQRTAATILIRYYRNIHFRHLIQKRIHSRRILQRMWRTTMFRRRDVHSAKLSAKQERGENVYASSVPDVLLRVGTDVHDTVSAYKSKTLHLFQHMT